MISLKQLSFKLLKTTETITAHSGFALFDAFIKNSGIKQLIETYMPLPGSNRGYTAWQYIPGLTHASWRGPSCRGFKADKG